MDTLLCWHSERHGIEVLYNAVGGLKQRGINIGRVIYLLQAGKFIAPGSLCSGDVVVHQVEIPLVDPTNHRLVHAALKEYVFPKLADIQGRLHVNISPGTPAMHSIWLLLHAGGAFPEGTQLWSSQSVAAEGCVRVDEVAFPITTYLAELRRSARVTPSRAIYDPDIVRSPARRSAFERISRFARVKGVPLLVLGERGTGKTRLVESVISIDKQRDNVVTVACGTLDSELMLSEIFGHVRGAFTNANKNRAGFLKDADKGILFLDEVQDLTRSAQRKLVRVFQDARRRFRSLGNDKETSVDVELVCASNLPVEELRTCLDPDFFDRISMLSVTLPPLRECREDLRNDWANVWCELRSDNDLPAEAPWSEQLEEALQLHSLPGNMRDLQKLAALCMAFREREGEGIDLSSALSEWKVQTEVAGDVLLDDDAKRFGSGTRNERTKRFQRELASYMYRKEGSWTKAALSLGCDEKTLRNDVKQACN